MRILSRGSDRRDDAASWPVVSLCCLGLIAAITVGSGRAEGQVAIEVDVAPAEAAAADTTAPAAPEDPTPAVAGLPRREAMAWLRSLPPVAST